MKFPLSLSFKILALAPQISVIDADDSLQFYVRQKLLKFKESVDVYADAEQKRLVAGLCVPHSAHTCSAGASANTVLCRLEYPVGDDCAGARLGAGTSWCAG